MISTTTTMTLKVLTAFHYKMEKVVTVTITIAVLKGGGEE
jgi:hypothetical protein